MYDLLLLLCPFRMSYPKPTLSSLSSALYRVSTHSGPSFLTRPSDLPAVRGRGPRRPRGHRIRVTRALTSVSETWSQYVGRQELHKAMNINDKPRCPEVYGTSSYHHVLVHSALTGP